VKKILVLFGTRPEAIKVAPLIHELRKSVRFETIICSTGQHKEMLEQVMEFFEISPDHSLDAMSFDQPLNKLSSILFSEIDIVIKKVDPAIVLVQGDTTSTMIDALASFYRKTRVAHVEAGLRSGMKYSPFPEEINRVITSRCSDYHFAPTQRAVDNLIREGTKPEFVHLVGNTVVDALFWGLEKLSHYSPDSMAPYLRAIDYSKRIILVTGHRRENFGEPFFEVCSALKKIASDEDVEVVYPVHLNPNVKKPVYSILGGLSGVHLIPPLDYASMIGLMNASYLILTDSGGIQEEAPSLRKPVLIMREVTERPEGIECGVTKLVGTSLHRIVSEVKNLLHNQDEYEKMATGINPYGDGTASQKIRAILENVL
jgi:UDP-N-acetylglucosamine 2-epimerase (non-hydrolysing)